MEKCEILKVVKSMLLEWENGLQYANDFSKLSNLGLEKGFCSWLNHIDFYGCIIMELKKDLLYWNVRTFFQYWYKCPFYFEHENKDFTEILFYRIDHLKRTITRLETELQN
jgi:hypothetical protein